MHIYLSPHHDDVCFSLAHLAAKQGGALISIFTVSDYVEASIALPSEREVRIAFVTALRRAEDEAFARAAGLTRHDLGLEEPPVRGLEPFDRTGIEEDVQRIAGRLVPYVLGLVERTEDESHTLYCPMAIGGHRDHLSVLLAVHGAAALARRCALFLYEDLHYASNPRLREAGMAFAARLFQPRRLARVAIRLNAEDAARKLKGIGLYRSQHKSAPRLADYIPASKLAPAPHEMLWQLK